MDMSRTFDQPKGATKHHRYKERGSSHTVHQDVSKPLVPQPWYETTAAPAVRAAAEPVGISELGGCREKVAQVVPPILNALKFHACWSSPRAG